MTPWVQRLIFLNVGMFIASQLAPVVYVLFALVPAQLLVRPWSLITYTFLHGDLMHLLFNMLGLFFFGPKLEALLGGKNFLLIYFLSGLGGGVLSFLFAFNASVVGASGAVLGVLAAYGRFWPDDRIYLWAILPVSARTMVIALVVLSVYSGLTGAGAGVAHFAHLGGLVVGWAFVVLRARRRRSAWPAKQKRGTLASGLAEARKRRDRWESIQLEQLHEINRAEAERVLAKLREGGPGALTPGEQEFLDRMAPR